MPWDTADDEEPALDDFDYQFDDGSGPFYGGYPTGTPYNTTKNLPPNWQSDDEVAGSGAWIGALPPLETGAAARGARESVPPNSPGQLTHPIHDPSPSSLVSAGYKCLECDYFASSKELLKTHAKDEEHKAFPCDFPGCNKVYRQPDGVSKHRRAHTNNKLQCPSCEMLFYRKDHFKNHLKRKKHKVSRTGEQCLGSGGSSTATEVQGVDNDHDHDDGFEAGEAEEQETRLFEEMRNILKSRSGLERRVEKLKASAERLSDLKKGKLLLRFIGSMAGRRERANNE